MKTLSLHTKRRTIALILAVTLMAATLAGCSGNNGNGGSNTAPPSASPTQSPDDATVLSVAATTDAMPSTPLTMDDAFVLAESRGRSPESGTTIDDLLTTAFLTIGEKASLLKEYIDTGREEAQNAVNDKTMSEVAFQFYSEELAEYELICEFFAAHAGRTDDTLYQDMGETLQEFVSNGKNSDFKARYIEMISTEHSRLRLFSDIVLLVFYEPWRMYTGRQDGTSVVVEQPYNTSTPGTFYLQASHSTPSTQTTPPPAPSIIPSPTPSTPPAQTIRNTEEDLKKAIENSANAGTISLEISLFNRDRLSLMGEGYFNDKNGFTVYANRDRRNDAPKYNDYYVFGKVINGVPDGNCTLMSVEESSAEPALSWYIIHGTFVNGKLNGYGQATDYFNRVEYTGYFKDGLFHGQGEYKQWREGGLTAATENTWSGEWRNGELYMGSASIIDSGYNRVSHTGYFENGFLQGLGRMYDHSTYLMYWGYFDDSVLIDLLGYEDRTDEALAGMQSTREALQRIDNMFAEMERRSAQIWSNTQSNIDRYRNSLKASQPPTRLIPIPEYGTKREDRTAGSKWPWVVGY
ncbi:MAG: hypothetical protein LBI19_08385 [Oscillospiraceae bacterium]|jgi:hypothetical protein|nr:hypothetical protein [Oscillospiraceae bacterium]